MIYLKVSIKPILYTLTCVNFISLSTLFIYLFFIEHLNIIPYEQFSEVKLISNGGYTSMYSSIWKGEIKVALKIFRDISEIDFEFLSSLNSCLNLRHYKRGPEYYGITK